MNKEYAHTKKKNDIYITSQQRKAKQMNNEQRGDTLKDDGEKNDHRLFNNFSQS